MQDSVAYGLAIAIMIGGFICAILPFVPGPPIVWLGALVYGWETNWQGIGWLSLAVLLVVALVGGTSDWWLSTLLMKRSGASPWASLGSIVGGIVGFFVPIPLGVILGSLAGVAVVELLTHGDLRRMFRSGSGFLVGWLLSTVVEVVASLAMIGWFLVATR